VKKLTMKNAIATAFVGVSLSDAKFRRRVFK